MGKPWVSRLSDIEEKLVRKIMMRKDGASTNVSGQRRDEESGAFMWAVGCQVGSWTEGERTEASGKGTGSPSYEPLARSFPKVVIQFTGGTL